MQHAALRRQQEIVREGQEKRHSEELPAKDNVLRLTQNLLAVSRDREEVATSVARHTSSTGRVGAAAAATVGTTKATSTLACATVANHEDQDDDQPVMSTRGSSLTNNDTSNKRARVSIDASTSMTSTTRMPDHGTMAQGEMKTKTSSNSSSSHLPPSPVVSSSAGQRLRQVRPTEVAAAATVPLSHNSQSHTRNGSRIRALRKTCSAFRTPCTIPCTAGTNECN